MKILLNLNSCWMGCNFKMSQDYKSCGAGNIGLFEIKTTPNPTSDKLMISFNSNISLADNALEVINVEGKVVYKTPIDIYTGINTIEITVSTLKGGVYFVKYTASNGENYKTKFIKN